jgi:hypothetical protein
MMMQRTLPVPGFFQEQGQIAFLKTRRAAP